MTAKTRVAARRRSDGQTVDEQFLAAEERDARPVDELGHDIPAHTPADRCPGLQLRVKLSAASKPILCAFVGGLFRQQRVMHRGRVMLVKAVLRVGADPVEEVVRILAAEFEQTSAAPP